MTTSPALIIRDLLPLSNHVRVGEHLAALTYRSPDTWLVGGRARNLLPTSAHQQLALACQLGSLTRLLVGINVPEPVRPAVISGYRNYLNIIEDRLGHEYESLFDDTDTWLAEHQRGSALFSPGKRRIEPRPAHVVMRQYILELLSTPTKHWLFNGITYEQLCFRLGFRVDEDEAVRTLEACVLDHLTLILLGVELPPDVLYETCLHTQGDLRRLDTYHFHFGDHHRRLSQLWDYLGRYRSGTLKLAPSA